jgi:hypothetical protein
MVLRYNISPDDIVAFKLFLLKNIPAKRRSAFWVKWRLPFPLCVTIMVLGVYYSDPMIAVAGVWVVTPTSFDCGYLNGFDEREDEVN